MSVTKRGDVLWKSKEKAFVAGHVLERVPACLSRALLLPSSPVIL